MSWRRVLFVDGRWGAASWLVMVGLLLAVLPSSAAANVTQVSIGTVHGAFYFNPNNSGALDSSYLTTPVFTQDFPVIDFNPPASAQVSCSNSTGVDENTRPFTDVVPNTDGTCSTIVARGNGQQAGAGDLPAGLIAFQAVFTANLTVAAPGQVTFNLFSDDGWMLGAGQRQGGTEQPTYVSGSNLNPLSSTPIKHYPVVGSFNTNSSPAQNQVTVAFQAAGTYPIELDYTECCGGQLSLVLGTTFGNPIPHGSTTLTLLNTMQVQPCDHHRCGAATITAHLLGPDGSPIANQLIKLNLTLVGSTKNNPPPLQPPAPQLTNSNGLASFTFTTNTPEAVKVHATASDPASGQILTSNEADIWFTPPPSALSPIGALVYTRGGNCSGTIVRSLSGLVVVTAAHCVIDAEAEGPGHWIFGPAYDFAQAYAPYGVWTVSGYVIDRNNYPGDEAYDYAFFVIKPDDNGRTVQQIADGFGGNFTAIPGRGFTQYAYPAAAGPGGPAGLITCKPKHGSTAYEQSPDSNGAAMYNLSCNNPEAFIGSSSGGPLINDSDEVAGILQGPKTGVFFNGVVGAFLSPAARPLFDSANTAACNQVGVKC